jgi:ATP-dependent protease ClpP protease subunit
MNNNINTRRNFINRIGVSILGLTSFPLISNAEIIEPNNITNNIINSKDFDNETIEIINFPNNQESNSKYLVERDNNKIYFYGDVSEESTILLQKALLEATINSKELSMIFNIEPIPIEIHIRSPGGSVLSIFGLIDYIKNSEIPIYSFIDGYSASAATLLSIVCKKRFITKHSFMLIHQLSSNTSGKFNEMSEELNNLNLFMNTIKEIYLSNSKINENNIDEILKHDDWFSAEKCVDLGLVDEIL